MNNENALATLTPEQAQLIPAIIQQMMGPLVESLGEMMKNNTEALNRLAEAQQMQADRMDALEKQIRLNTLVTPQQVKYFNDAIRARARELLDKRGMDDDKAAKRLGTMIRKNVLSRYGVGALHDIPKHEYSVAMNHIGTWNDMLAVRDVIKEARKRLEPEMDETEPAAHLDGAQEMARMGDQHHKRGMRKSMEG